MALPTLTRVAKCHNSIAAQSFLIPEAKSTVFGTLRRRSLGTKGTEFEEWTRGSD